MPSVCLYYQVHQPSRLRRYSIFDTESHYFDDYKNGEICRKIAHKCYVPANRLMLKLIDRFDGRFKLAYSLSGVVLEQFKRFTPELVDSFVKLAETGCVEFLAETYYHSLSFLYSREEFEAQLELHASLMENLFGQRPSVFRNTELIFNNDLAHHVAQLGYRGALCEGTDSALGHRSPNYLYHPPGCPGLSLLLKNYRLSDDIAFRFSNKAWPEWPLTPRKFADWLNLVNGNGHTVNLFMDYETLGEHQWADTGIFEFMDAMPGEILKHRDNVFQTPSEAISAYPTSGEFDLPHMTSWADTERDLSAWLGNAMQSNAMHELYRLEHEVKAAGDDRLLTDWRLLQSSDHFYYMCVKYFADGDVHKYFSPYDSPYDSYINFMNVLDNLRSRTRGSRGAGLQHVSA